MGDTPGQLTIGKAGRKPFDLPLEVATQAMAVHGVRGKGKTVTATVVVEELLEHGVQVVVIDPTDVWWGLKSSEDGEEPGYPMVILGGHHADLPLEPGMGAAVADFAVDHGASLILSLRHLRKGAQRQFVTDFAEQLYHRKGEVENRTPLFLAIDEASQFVPQRVMGDSARMVGAIQDIVRLGRHAGLGVALIDQRPASVNKDVLTQIEVLVCHAVTSPQDRKALDDWIRQKDSSGHRDAFLEHLASLPRGEAWFWFPIADVFERVAVRMRHTFDSSKTPEIGEAPVAPTTRAEVDLGELRAALDETLAAAEANDPKVLKKRIAQLEAELRKTKAESGLTPEEAEEMARERARHAVLALRSEVRPHVEALHHALANGSEAVVPDAPARAIAMPTPKHREISAPSTPRPTPKEHQTPSPAGEGLTGPQQKLLNALARLESVGVTAPDRANVAAFAGYTASGGTFQNYVGSLRSAGLVDYPSSGRVQLSAEGRAWAEWPDTPATLGDLHSAWLEILPGPHSKILEALLGSYPVPLTREELAEVTGYTAGGGTFQNYLGRLRSLGLADYPVSGEVVATELLFPTAMGGRRG